MAVTPADLERREAELERKMRDYGYDLTDFDSAQLQRVLKLGQVTFEVTDDEGNHKRVFVDLINERKEEEKAPKPKKKERGQDEDFD